jgi:hypothetical protein
MNRRSFYTLAGLLTASAILYNTYGAEAFGPIPSPALSGRPNLKFACELDTGRLQALFSDPQVIADLVALDAGVVLRTSDLSTERGAIVQQLNRAGIPVTAWLALPKERGYFFNADNAAEGAPRFAEFKAWTTANGLRWAGVGLDVEPNFRELQSLTKGGIWHLVPALIRRGFDNDRLYRAKQTYTSLIQQIRARGYSVETYQFFFLADERKARSTLLEKLSGIVDIPADRECLMLYTSFHHSWGSSVIWSYGPQTKCIVVGSTGGDSALDAGFAPLNWNELIRDLRAARYWTPNIGIYSLEGCVRQGLLPRLRAVDWTQPVTRPRPSARMMVLRGTIGAFLWLNEYLYLLLALLMATGALLWRARKSRTLRRL